MAEIKIDENASGPLKQDRTDGVSCVSSSHATWRNLGGPSLIQRQQLNRNDSHSCLSSELLIEDQTLHPTLMPNLPYKLRCSSIL